MNGRTWIALVSLFLLAQAQAASFDCRKAQSETERLICTNPVLGELDEELANVYARVREVAPDKRTLTLQQRKWIDSVRNACQDLKCLYQVHKERSAELAELLVDLAPILDTPLSDQEGRSVCQELARLADARDLQKLAVPGFAQLSGDESAKDAKYRITKAEQKLLDGRDFGTYTSAGDIFRLRLRQRDAPVRFANFSVGGSCPAEAMANLSHILSAQASDSGVDEVPDPGEKIRWAYWGGGDYPIIYRNRNFVVTSDLGNRNQANMISWIKPNGRIRPLCLLEVAARKKAVVSAKNRDLCEAVASNTRKPAHPPDLSDQIPDFGSKDRDEFVKRYGRYADSMKMYKLDINSDGKVENLGHFTYDSGAGCGSHEVWLSQLSADGSRIVESPLNGLLGRLNEASAVYVHGGQHYIEGASQADGFGVFQIRGAELEPVCKFRYDNFTEVREFFSVTD